MKKIILLLIIFVINKTYSQDSNFELLPGGLNFASLKAGYQEARIGLTFIPENNNMKLDIGNVIDVLGFRFSEAKRITAGIEFYAYALSTSYAGKRLQIDAVDGIFGGNLSYSENENDKLISMRLRILHNSAHLVDGHWDGSINRWINNDIPIPYAKDFIEYTLAYEHNSPTYVIKGYGGLSYAFLIRPSDMKRLNMNCGIELGLTDLFGSIIGKGNSIFVAHHFFLSGTSVFMGSNNSMLGFKFGNWDEGGILFFVSYYNGSEIFHSYYRKRVERLGVGFTTDLL